VLKNFLRRKFYFSERVLGSVDGSVWCFGRCFRWFSVTFYVGMRDF